MKLKPFVIMLAGVTFIGALIYFTIPREPAPRKGEVEALMRLKESGSLEGEKVEKTSFEKTFTEKTINFSEMHRRFPGNRALPALSPEVARKKRAERRKRNLLYGKIASNRATDEEISRYYREQSAIARDVLQLVDFVLTEYGGKLTEKEVKKYRFLKEQFQNRVDIIPRKEKIARERIEKYRQKKENGAAQK